MGGLDSQPAIGVGDPDPGVSRRALRHLARSAGRAHDPREHEREGRLLGVRCSVGEDRGEGDIS